MNHNHRNAAYIVIACILAAIAIVAAVPWESQPASDQGQEWDISTVDQTLTLPDGTMIRVVATDTGHAVENIVYNADGTFHSRTGSGSPRDTATSVDSGVHPGAGR